MPDRRVLANAVRALAMDAVETAKNGHPGMPMGMADIAEVLWNDFYQHSPTQPRWANRDRFVLSNGHGSMLQYALLHLAGYDLPIEELKRFRELHSKTPGHPEYNETPGVETTTGPLGQGFANAVGFALAEQTLAKRFNRPGHEIVNHHTYVFMGDGCMMEGVSHEAASLAGTWKLGKLIAIYDDNGISIDGEVKGWFTDDSAKRFEAYGWRVMRDVDGHNPDSIKKALADATAKGGEQPVLIIARTIIGFGSPHKQGKEEAHGAPLGKDEIVATRDELDWRHAPFDIPADIYAAWDAKQAGAARVKRWDEAFAKYEAAFPELAAEFKRRIEGKLPADWAAKSKAYIKEVQEKGSDIASRKASQQAIGAFAPLLPELLGGSADLAPSNLTMWKGSKSVTEADGNYVHYGVREFGMSAIANGIALHGGFLPYDATFLVFSDYARNAVRMSALIPAHVIHVYTHDSIGLGADGPTHQPIEQVPSLRYIPNNHVWRPCDDVESAVAWQQAIERKGKPSCLIFSRQNLKHQPRSEQQLAGVARGGYVLSEPGDGKFKAILIATGSEVELATAAAAELAKQGLPVRVVSMPCAEVFDAQSAEYRESVLPKAVRARVAVEAAYADYWRKYVGLDGEVIGMTTFGASAPGEVLLKHFGFTAEKVLEAVKRVAA